MRAIEAKRITKRAGVVVFGAVHTGEGGTQYIQLVKSAWLNHLDRLPHNETVDAAYRQDEKALYVG